MVGASAAVAAATTSPKFGVDSLRDLVARPKLASRLAFCLHHLKEAM